VDIGSVADRVAADSALVARDGLHPSGTQYAAWVELIAPVAHRLLGGGPSAP
jgi:lysophospholipase L1-like esterase